MTLISLLSEPFVLFFLTDKWALTVPLLQWTCFAYIVRPINALNMSILNAIGRSDLFLKVDLSKIPLTIIALIVTIPLGVKAMVIGHVVVSFFAFFVNAYLPGKRFGYGAFSQIKDMSMVILSVLIMAVIVYFSTLYIESNILKLVVGGIIGAVSYMGVAILFKMDEAKEVMGLVNILGNKND